MIDLVCNERLLNRVRNNLERFTKRTKAYSSLKEAAVAIAIVDTEKNAAFL